MAYLYSTQPPNVAGAGNIPAKMYQVVDKIEIGTIGDESVSETYTCTFETKNYDYQSPSKWKRLGYWGADVLTRADIAVYAQPVQYASTITWGQAKLRTWGAAKLTTWGSPSGASLVQADNVSIAGLTNGRKFVKFLKSLRFRQISYKFVANTNGVLQNAPVRVYRLSTYVLEKQRVSKKIN